MSVSSTIPHSSNVPTLEQRLKTIRLLEWPELKDLATLVFTDSPLPWEYLDGLNDDDRTVAYRASLLAWAVTSGTQTPCEMQLRAILATYNGKDSLVGTGTGSGKTLPIALNLLLDDPADNGISLTISPFKRFRVTQEYDLNTTYGIPTIFVHDKTPKDDEYWKQHVHDTTTKNPGTARHIIVTVEQLFESKWGQLPRMAVLIRTPQFEKRIKRIYVDEAHSIHTVGLARNNMPASRPAWGRLDELKAFLPWSIPWQALSTTFPPHILKTVETKILRPNYVSIRTSSNRPNTTYATHCVVSNLEKLENYDCFLTEPFDFAAQPKVLIFFDDMWQANLVSNYLNDRLPVDLRERGIVRHYHSGMSEIYLQLVHNAFTDKDGGCKILCATLEDSLDVDFPDVKIVCSAGVPSDIVGVLQRSGCAGDHGLFIIFHEPWAHTISLDEFAHGDANDPDRPRANLVPTSTQQDRVAYSSLALIQCKDCLRSFFANYLDDKTLNALAYLIHCCDRHAGFRLEDFLPSPLFTDTETSNKRRPPALRKLCRARKERVIAWLLAAHENDSLRGFRATYDILSYSNRVKLVRAQANSLRTPQHITELFDENKEWEEEWAESLFSVLMEYERDLESRGKGTSIVNSHVPKKTKT